LRGILRGGERDAQQRARAILAQTGEEAFEKHGLGPDVKPGVSHERDGLISRIVVAPKRPKRALGVLWADGAQQSREARRFLRGHEMDIAHARLVPAFVERDQRRAHDIGIQPD
jgi:hypothetical protein